jgi:hypothetical protein
MFMICELGWEKARDVGEERPARYGRPGETHNQRTDQREGAKEKRKGAKTRKRSVLCVFPFQFFAPSR